jgi:hypothetical protein
MKTPARIVAPKMAPVSGPGPPSYDELARMLGLPVGAVKTYLFRARKSLATELAGKRVRKGGT